MKILKVFVILILIGGISKGITKADFIFGEPAMVPNVNSDFVDGSPQISRDGLELYMASKRDGGISKIWVSRRDTIKDPWSMPTKLEAPVNSAVSQSFPSLSADGLELYFSDGFQEAKDPMGYGASDIWVLTRASKDDPWSIPKNLGPAINSVNMENSPCISADGLELYFMSSIPDHPRNSEIVVSTRLSKDDPWGEPVTLNTNVNSNQYEYTPFISADGLSLFFSRGFSKSHIYVCRRASIVEPWGSAEFFAPVNSGYVNDVWGFSPESAEYHACFADEDPTIYFTRSTDLFANDYNIWQVEVTPVIDLNSDGIVDATDMCIIVDNWHTENPLCDIAPAPLGDGFVDVQDLIVLAEHLFEEVPLGQF
jgi:hypothetical protein